MQGHETNFFINDVPYQAKEYSAYISGLVNENLFKAITNPSHFNSLKWEQRRETLIKIAGGFNEQEIINTRKEFVELFTKINSDTANAYGIAVYDVALKVWSPLNICLATVSPAFTMASRSMLGHHLVNTTSALLDFS